MEQYRHLTEEEIKQIELQGCSATDWKQITVSYGFNAKYVRNAKFSGTCQLGTFDKSFEMPGGIHKHSGIYNATLHNVTVGDNTCIDNIRNYIANYDIAEDCFIENVDIILVDGATSFGNGVEVSVLNETGGREVTIHDQLTAQEAYIVAMYRHRPTVVNTLKDLAKQRAKERCSNRGAICCHSTIVGTNYIKNMYIGPYCKIEGAGKLKNGSLMSKKESPILIGHGVMADDFIVQDGSSIEDCAMISRCYIGQACTLGHGYTASDSLFFCNCQEENGEACAIFAGPFTVTHHKSTLLIAGMFSFMNAGSGSNQSNHMYKLGPIHQGALERGAKTASDSYILWPARIGAFSLVMGRHSTNADTSQMPFSYLIEKKGETYIAPAVNLRSVGTIRDAQKWPKRDKRNKEQMLDLINFNLLSPYTIQKMEKGLEILNHLKELSGATSDTYSYQSAKITNSSLHRGIELYRIAITKFIGNSVISRLEKISENGNINFTQFAPHSNDGLGEWIDLAGLIAPHIKISQMLNAIENGELSSLEQINGCMKELHTNYYDLEWTWAYQLLLRFYNKKSEDITIEFIKNVIEEWRDAVVKLDKMLYQDARKEFSLSAHTGFGFDGNEVTTNDDFTQVRGDFDQNPFVTAVLEHIQVKSNLCDKWLQKLASK